MAVLLNLIWSGRGESDPPLKLGKSRLIFRLPITIKLLYPVSPYQPRADGIFFFCCIEIYLQIFAVIYSHFTRNKVQIRCRKPIVKTLLHRVKAQSSLLLRDSKQFDKTIGQNLIVEKIFPLC